MLNASFGRNDHDGSRMSAPRRAGRTANAADGKPIVRDIRISVALVPEMRAAEDSAETMLRRLPSPPADIRACLAFAHHVLAWEHVYGWAPVREAS